MFVYGKIFPGLIISFFAFACTLEPVCQKEEAIECLRVPEEGVDHRICRGGEWLDAQCRISEVCLENSCVFLTEDCNENNKRCLTSRHVEVCTASSKAKVELCEEGFVCDEKACAQGEDCCVAIKTCSETVKQCLNLKTVEVCEASSMAQIVTCEEGFICDDNACAQGKDCCVASTTCGKTYDSCSDEDTVMVCVEGAYPIVKSCELGEICKRGQCVEDVCRNHRFDLGEEAIDCGGSCAPCKTCQSDADCGKQGFCDSAFNHLCSKRCRKDSDCAQSELWDGEFCRNDGRCSPKVFETQWALTGTDLSIVLPFDPEYPSGKCDFQILWGDEAAGVDVSV